MRNSELIHKSIMQDMTEGVMTIGLDGVISYVNPAAAMILGMNAQDLTGKKFIQCFFEYSEKDAFNQTILDAVYDSATTHRNVVAYYTGKNFRQREACKASEGGRCTEVREKNRAEKKEGGRVDIRGFIMTKEVRSILAKSLIVLKQKDKRQKEVAIPLEENKIELSIP